MSRGPKGPRRFKTHGGGKRPRACLACGGHKEIPAAKWCGACRGRINHWHRIFLSYAQPIVHQLAIGCLMLELEAKP